MDRKSIPGYYYDEEKKKFFKIQPGHQLPEGAKYSVGNVHREKRQAKRQRLVDKHDRTRQEQTVRRSAALVNALIGRAGLNRELDGTRPAQVLKDHNAALAAQLRSSRIWDVMFEGDHQRGSGAVVLDALYDAAQNELTTFTFEPQLQCQFHIGISMFKSFSHGSTSKFSGGGLAFKYSHDNLNVIHDNVQGVEIIVSDQGRQSSHMYRRAYSNGDHKMVTYNMDTTPEAIAVQPQGSKFAVRQYGRVTTWDVESGACAQRSLGIRVKDEEDSRFTCPAIDWLDHWVQAYGLNLDDSKYLIRLQDTRAAGDWASRFSSSERITGIRVADDWGCRLLVSTNRLLKLYDTRMGKQPYLQFDHVHEGPQLQFATNKLGLVAAVDRDNIVQSYSTRTGSRLGALKMPTSEALAFYTRVRSKALIRSLRWTDGGREGTILTACQGMSVLKWDWHGEHDLGEFLGKEDAIPGRVSVK